MAGIAAPGGTALPVTPAGSARLSAPCQAAFQGSLVSVHVRCEGGQDPKQQIMDFVMKQALGGATKDMGKMLGGDEEKDPDAAKKEEERQEALRQQEEERKAKYAKMEAEREVMRQGIRDKINDPYMNACVLEVPRKTKPIFEVLVEDDSVELLLV
ncbi:hypothetical protein HGM15179_015908 [Zosterops borbonicus]|uniref:Complexin-1 n=1 Tax=Zosterops borbonicus TaxID=364589 RepID=A0A8K1LET7_9PASS|nr:hypothetical protein HGM15179_015908 [Zosterops borbonicus]